MKLTHHSKLRLSQRANINKENQKQFFISALRKGKSWNNIKKGKLRDYLQSKENHKCKAKVYQGYIFIYSKNNKLLYTVYEIPKELLIKEEIVIKPKTNSKPVYLYDLDNKLIRKFETTKECAEYFDKEPEYINHNLKYCDKIRKDSKWYRIRRCKIDKN